MRVDDLIHVFNNLLHQLSVADAIGVSLLFMLEYQWDRVILDFTYRQPHTIFDKTEDHLNPNAPRISSRHTYTLQRFVYAFKIWIMETFSNSSIAGSHIPDVILRVVAYPRMRYLHDAKCEHIHDVTDVCSLVHVIIYKFL
uniref:Uncharacterized protein n=1 Tax=Lactuca sativa TaxID=4236 RepID=A0A9R1WU90_LACSA|nr:hypothetical protein LSAT_V11C900464810 [Lactuca sativa]